jgi:PAS domain S-box-containing protein
LALVLLWTGAFSSRLQWTLTVFMLLWYLGFALAAKVRVGRPLQTLSNLLGALREGDFSIRARGAAPDDALGLAMFEVNQLGETLRQQRLGAVEATALLRAVMHEIDVAVFAFDEAQRLRLVNRAGERVLGATAPDVLGQTASEVGLEDCLYGASHRVLEASFFGGGSRWELRRGAFRQEGRPHQLVVLADLSRTLREEERQAWKRLVRVLSHEINNSLAPIHSTAGSLKTLVARAQRPSDWEDDLERGLEVIGGRAQALIRFMQSYARLARLPAPNREPLRIGTWVRRVVRLETRLSVVLVPGEEKTISADGDQLDQLLINLVSNAVDAALEANGGVRVGWECGDRQVEVWVEDDGPGLPDSSNLFVPFFTTKPKGSGIGLVLSRQIAEAHGGTLNVVNRRDDHGCVARLRLPLGA